MRHCAGDDEDDTKSRYLRERFYSSSLAPIARRRHDTVVDCIAPRYVTYLRIGPWYGQEDPGGCPEASPKVISKHQP